MDDVDGYRNPVIPGFYPDPSVCRVGNEYFLVTSTFSYFPGVPIFRSLNLVDWVQLGNVLDRPSQLDLTSTEWMSRGVYAPTIRHCDGKFWVITTVTGQLGQKSFFVTATDPAGPWSEPVHLDIAGIDPDIAWDANGDCWVHTSHDQAIIRYRIDDATGAVLEGPEKAWSGTGLQFPEAPHLYERHGTWYLLIAEGGTERGHAVSIARSPTPEGPWEGCPANPILSHRSTSRAVQNTGHADLVEAEDGSWWMALLGVRPRGVTPGFHVLGRETFLTSFEWVNGWPVVDPVEIDAGRRPPGPRLQTPEVLRDDFDHDALGPQWIAIRRPPESFSSLTARPGWLTLTGTDHTLDSRDSPSFVGRRQQHHHCRVRTAVELGPTGEAGLAIVMDDMAHFEVMVQGPQIVARARSGPFLQIVGEAERPPGVVVLHIETAPLLGLGPDAVRLGYEDAAGESHLLAELDGRYLSTEVCCGFIGRVIGPYAVGCEASFDWFEYQGDSLP